MTKFLDTLVFFCYKWPMRGDRLDATDWVETVDRAASKLARPSAAQFAAQAIRTAILSGGIGRGEALNESQLASALHVSRNSVREALRLLTLEGLLVQQPHRSAIVTTITTEDVADIFAIRRLIEFGAVDLVAHQHSELDLSPLERAIRELVRLRRESEPAEVLEADRAFHEALVALARSPRLTAAYSRIEGEVRLCMSISTRSHNTVDELVDQHQHLLDLLKVGEFDGFKSYLGEHMDRALESVSHVLAQSGEALSSPAEPPAPGRSRMVRRSTAASSN